MSVDTVRPGKLPGDRRYWYGALVALLIAWPLVFDAFWTRIGLGALMWIGLAQSWNLIGGYAGYLDFGHGAYFGIGGFAAGIAMAQFGQPFVVGFGLAIAASVAVAYLVAIPTLRLTGAYFAIATWAFAEAIKQAALVLGITGGTYGLSLPRSPEFLLGVPLPIAISETFFYYAMLLLCALTMGITYYFFERHEFGYRVKALRDDQDAAESLGIDTTRVKRQVYVLSCAIAGVFGAVHAWYIIFIHPNDILGPIVTDRMVIMALLGGLGTVTGPVVGGLLVFLLERLSSVFLGSSTYYLPLIGLLIMVTVLFAPSGLIGVVRGEVQFDDVKRNVRGLAEKFDLL